MDKDYKTIKIVIREKIATVFLDRPDVHNAFNDLMLLELIDVLKKINEHTGIRVVVFTGNGKSFSAGADLNWMRSMIDYDFGENLEDSLKISELFYRIYKLNKPVISAINGAAIGGGMGFVGASDIVIASDRAVFSMSEVKIGVVPACVSPYLIKRAGEGVLRELFLTGERFDSKRALSLNLINYAVKHEDLMMFTYDMADRLKKNGPEAQAVCKKLFNKVPGMDLKTAFNYTAEVIAKLRISDEAQEGMRAFLDKREPSWKE